ncbi:MAG: hypothetical protein JWL62_1711 [Hyphomicrobiales bacterium]|nr:hypothetical protein [Hyphomicrobiales bacterium]
MSRQRLGQSTATVAGHCLKSLEPRQPTSVRDDAPVLSSSVIVKPEGTPVYPFADRLRKIRFDGPTMTNDDLLNRNGEVTEREFPDAWL